MKLKYKTRRMLSLVTCLLLCLTFLNFNSLPSGINKNYSILEKMFQYSRTDGDLPDWALLDPDKDGYEGTRTKTFYEHLKSLNISPAKKDVIVAVIDSGFDIDHPDLKENIWSNEKEINGTPGVDDDSNGYVDDFHGWNFLGNVKYLPLEVAREYYRLKKAETPLTDKYYQKVISEFENKKDETLTTQRGIDETVRDIEDAEKTLKEKNITTDPRKLQEISNELEGKYSDAASVILGVYLLFGTDKKELLELKEEYDNKAKYLFEDTDTHSLIGDDPEVLLETNYGNNNVVEVKEIHGTHVAGIIASQKTGQAPFAKIMCLRGVPNEGDERDKDIGNAIRYAVDNGASIINMSAGKYFSLNPEFVTDAIKYAESKGVLFVISAGNEGEDASVLISYPRKFIEENGEKKYFSNMIVVGASSWMKQWSKAKDPENQNVKYDLAAPFSNYSKEVVDIFAPGVKINSTIPNGKYKKVDGTSMAAPEVAGVAAVIKAYYPEISAAQLKEVIVSSARKYDGLLVKVKDKSSRVLFSNLSKSGGVIDMMNAYKKASEVMGLEN